MKSQIALNNRSFIYIIHFGSLEYFAFLNLYPRDYVHYMHYLYIQVHILCTYLASALQQGAEPISGFRFQLEQFLQSDYEAGIPAWFSGQNLDWQ